ncbi:MAG TPA: S8/S53 family peptidase, partial [Bacteroidia bacterium]|nr:S8/S53 family peptidase [Bacteroidia bacterium]
CAAAVTDNNTGVASPGYNTKFMPVKIADASGALTVAYEGIVYAADHGCSIINCSWGGSGGGSFGQDVVEYATINMDALVVASAGNDGAESDLYPAAYDYVLAVASTGTNDAKSNFSNYGPFIDVCAPGSNIYSTIYNNTYTFQSGTSMAAPIASGAAAIVKAMHPTFNAQQVGEQLRITCDNIYGVPSNNIYIDKLGKGRINMFRSITETSPSVRLKNIVITDNNDNAFVIGDTLDISGDFINYLDPTVNLDITVTTSSPWVTMIDNNTFVGALGTMATVNNTNDPFLFKINPGTPQNTKIRFKINYADAPYADFQLLDVTVNVDYINVAINEIATTITSKGRLCYNNETQQEGLGFQYNGENLVYEAGLMVGTGITTVSDNVRGAAATDNDFQSQLVVQKVLPSVVSEFDLYGQFNDSPASPSIPVTITHKAYAWSTPGNTKFVIVEYAIKNSGSSTLSNLYAGIFADWDIMDYSLNKADETPALKMGHVHSTQTAGLWAGIKVLTSGPFVHYGIDNIAGMGGVNMTDGYDTGEKYTTLSTSRPQAGTTGNGNDVIDVVSTGPYSIAAGDSVVVAFALIAGDDLNDLNTSAANAQIKYDNILLSLQPEGTEMPSALPYPNPVNNTLNIISTSSGLQNISVYDLSGREVIHSASRLTSGTPLTLDVSVLSPGIYTIMILSETGNTVLKFTKN